MYQMFKRIFKHPRKQTHIVRAYWIFRFDQTLFWSWCGKELQPGSKGPFVDGEQTDMLLPSEIGYLFGIESDGVFKYQFTHKICKKCIKTFLKFENHFKEARDGKL